MRATFHKALKEKADKYAYSVYKLSSSFPKHETYGITQQLRRSALSVPLNYIEGYARGKDKPKVYKNFLEISYGSLRESEYLLQFCIKLNYLEKEQSALCLKLSDELGAMLWTIIKRL